MIREVMMRLQSFERDCPTLPVTHTRPRVRSMSNFREVGKQVGSRFPFPMTELGSILRIHAIRASQTWQNVHASTAGPSPLVPDLKEKERRLSGVFLWPSSVTPSGSALSGYPCSNLRAALKPHLRQQGRNVVLHGLFCDTQFCANFSVRQAIADQFQDLTL